MESSWLPQGAKYYSGKGTILKTGVYMQIETDRISFPIQLPGDWQPDLEL